MIRADAPRADVEGGFLIADQDPAAPRWSVPSRLSIAAAGDGTPLFSLVRFQSQIGAGGMLQVTLAAVAPPGGTPAPLREAFTRLRLRSPSLSGGGRDFDWTPAAIGARGEARIGCSLSPEETGLLTALLADGTSSVEVEAVLVFPAAAGAMPVVARVEVARLLERLRMSVPADMAAPADVLAEAGAAAIASDPSLVSLRRTDRAGGEGAPAGVNGEIVRRLLPRIATEVEPESPRESPRYRLLQQPPSAKADVSLTAFRADELRIPCTWSVAGFLRGLSPQQRSAAFPDIVDVDVLENVDVRVLATVPLDERFLARVDVGLRYRDIRNEVQRPAVTLAPAKSADAVRISHNTTRPLAIERRVTAVLRSGAGWPRIMSLPYLPCRPVVDIDAETLGLRFVEVAADPAVLARASAVRVDVQRAAAPDVAVASVTLTSAAPRASVALPAAEPSYAVTVTAFPPSGAGAPLVLRRGPLPRRIDVSPADLLSAAPVEVRFAIAPHVHFEQHPYVAVTVRAQGMSDQFLLLGEDPEKVQIFPADPFQPVRFSYQAEWQSIGAGGAPGPIVRGSVREAFPPTVLVDPAAEGGS